METSEWSVEKSVLDPRLEEIGRIVLDAAFDVHRKLGAGILESVLKAHLRAAIERRGVAVLTEVGIPLVIDGIRSKEAFRVDLLVGGLVIVEVKSVAQLLPVHFTQLTTYLRLSGRELGYLINFNVPLLKHGFHRIILTESRAEPRPS
ncbi:MAG: GxxExxY protein [Thermoplasmatota archaeon]